MSGGHFNYEDARALETVTEQLAAKIGEMTYLPYTEPDIELDNVKALLQVSLILKQWLHDYDWQMCSDANRFNESSRSALLELKAMTNVNGLADEALAIDNKLRMERVHKKEKPQIDARTEHVFTTVITRIYEEILEQEKQPIQSKDDITT